MNLKNKYANIKNTGIVLFIFSIIPVFLSLII